MKQNGSNFNTERYNLQDKSYEKNGSDFASDI